MNGVVLWAEGMTGKAVIWCEDHGELAFLLGGTVAGGRSVSEGDLLQFDLVASGGLRLARWPRLLSGGEYAGLAKYLLAQVQALDADQPSPRVLPFPHPSDRRGGNRRIA